jgi:hypothetical protein
MRIAFVLLCFMLSLAGESVAGLQWKMPAGWKAEASRPMRAATYTIPPAGGDHETAECAVYFFGAGQGGSVEANIARWKGQFQGPGGKPAVAQEKSRTIHGLKVTTIDTSGEYSGMGGPMAASKTVKSGYRLLGAVVESPEGNVFVKFAGPAATVAANQAKFEQLLGSFEKERK